MELPEAVSRTTVIPGHQNRGANRDQLALSASQQPDGTSGLGCPCLRSSRGAGGRYGLPGVAELWD